jgi:hypothetical protein
VGGEIKREAVGRREKSMRSVRRGDGVNLAMLLVIRI